MRELKRRTQLYADDKKRIKHWLDGEGVRWPAIANEWTARNVRV